MSSPKSVLISHFPLPYKGIASWTSMMNDLVKNQNEVDYIVCPKSTLKTDFSKQYFINKPTYFDRLKNKFDNNSRFNPYIIQIKKILLTENKITLNVLENIGLLKAIIHFIHKNDLKERVYLHFYYYYFLPFTNDDTILSSIDELTLQTNISYDYFIKHSNQLPFKVSVNHNGVDSSKFKLVDNKTKYQLRTDLSIPKDNLIFIWCSQDRPKKGLQLLLSIWNEIYEKHNKKVTLLIVGVARTITQDGVINIGRLQNPELPKYFQSSDFYLFPTLCQEGFGLSLAEALKCGCYCIASKNGAVPEVLDNGRFGKLIEKPNFEEQWIDGINKSIEEYKSNDLSNPYLKNVPEKIYDLNLWRRNMNTILKRAKQSFN